MLLLSVSGCDESAENDKITVMKPPSTTTTENIEAPESTQSDTEETQSAEEPVTEEAASEPDESEAPVSDEPADVPVEAKTEDPYAGYAKDNYQEDPWEFIGGVQQAIRESKTVEEMYRALAEFDSEGRIDKVDISIKGEPVTKGTLTPGMSFCVYYDDEASWFNFQY